MNLIPYIKLWKKQQAEVKCIQWLSERGLSAVGISELVLKQVPDSESDDWDVLRRWRGTLSRLRRAERSRSLTTSDVWDWIAAVYKILRRFK